MTYTRDMVERKVKQIFDPQEHTEAFEALNLCDSYGQNLERVQLACLKLCDGNINLLYKVIERMEEDFRDILVYAESPAAIQRNFSKLLPEEQNRLIAKDLEEYQAWLTADSQQVK